MGLKILLEAIKGGDGSGNHNHAGRPGRRGGSLPKGSSAGGKLDAGAMQAHIDVLSKRFGVVSPQVTKSEKLRGGGRLGSAKRIEIDEILTNDLHQFNSKYNDSLARSPREILTHELGHHIHFELQYNKKFDEYKMGLSAADRDRQGVSFADSLAVRMEKIAKTHGSKLSPYATKNGEEYFAEAFTAYNRGGKWREKIHPEVLKIFEGLDNES